MQSGSLRINRVGLAKKVQLILTIRCEEASQLVSESFERKLSWHERLAIKGHALVCWSCRQFAAQLKFLRSAMSNSRGREAEDLVSGPTMPDATRQRLKSLKLEEAED